MPKKEKEYHGYDELIEDMELVMKSLEMALSGINRLNEAGWLMMNTDNFKKFVKECGRIETILHFNIQEAKRLKEETKGFNGSFPF